MDEAVDTLRRLEGEIKQRLMLNPDFRALIAVQEAIAKIVEPELLGSTDYLARVRNISAHISATQGGWVAHSEAPGTGRNTASAVEEFLMRRGRPATARLIRNVLHANGNLVTAPSLSSILSRDERFRLVGDGGKRWWLVGQPYEQSVLGWDEDEREADDD